MGLFLNPDRQTSANRVLIALVCGAVTGAALFSVPLIAVLLFAQTVDTVAVMAIQLLIQPPLFLVGWVMALIVAAPGWWLLHRLGARTQATAVLYAAAPAFVIVLAYTTGGFELIPSSAGHSYSASVNGISTVIDGRMTTHGWIEALKASGITAATAGAVGWVVGFVAYRRAPGKRASETAE